MESEEGKALALSEAKGKTSELEEQKELTFDDVVEDSASLID